MAEMMSIKDFILFSFWLCNPFWPCLVTKNIEGLPESILLCTFLGRQNFLYYGIIIQIAFISNHWFDNEGLTLCVVSDLKQTYCNFLF